MKELNQRDPVNSQICGQLKVISQLLNQNYPIRHPKHLAGKKWKNPQVTLHLAKKQQIALLRID